VNVGIVGGLVILFVLAVAAAAVVGLVLALRGRSEGEQ
jgi:hypothetical protein